MNKFKDRVAIVTGAASGMGRALVLELSFKGAIVVCADINFEGLKEIEETIKREGGRVHLEKTDVAKAEEVERLVDDTVKKYGSLDYIFNNAGVLVAGEVRDLKLEHWIKQIEVNLMGVVYGTVYAYRQMVKQGHGHIVNTSSLGGLVAVPTIIPYTTTKYGVVGLSRSLRVEGKDLGVKVSVVCPGFVRTGMFDAEIVNVDLDKHRKNIEDAPKHLIWNTNRAARKILKGTAKNREIIIFPFYARLSNWLERLYPPLLNISRREMIKSLRNIRLGQEKTARIEE